MDYQAVMIGSDVDPPHPGMQLTLAAELVLADCKESWRTYDIASEQSASSTTPKAAESQQRCTKSGWTPTYCQPKNLLAPRLPAMKIPSFSHHFKGDMDTAEDSEGTLKPLDLSGGSSAEMDTGLNTVASLLADDTRILPGHLASGDQVPSACSASSSAEFLYLESLCENNNTGVPDYPALTHTVGPHPGHATQGDVLQSKEKECTCDTLGECQCPEEDCACPDYYRTEDTLGPYMECKCPEEVCLVGVCSCPDKNVCQCPESVSTCPPRLYYCPPRELSCPGCSEQRGHDVDGLCECPDPNCAGPDGLFTPYPGAVNHSSPSSTASSPPRNGHGSRVQVSSKHGEVPLDDQLSHIQNQDGLPPLCKPATSPQFSRCMGKKDPPHPLATNLPRLMKEVNLPMLLEEPEITIKALEHRKPRGDTASVTDVLSGHRLLQSTPVRKSLSNPNSFHGPRRKQEEHLFDCGPLNTNEAEHVCRTTFPVLKTSPSKRRTSKIPKLISRGTADDCSVRSDVDEGIRIAEGSESYVVSPRRASPEMEEPEINVSRMPSKAQDKKMSATNVKTIEKPPVVQRKPVLTRPTIHHTQGSKLPPPVAPKPTRSGGSKLSPPATYTARYGDSRRTTATSPDMTQSRDSRNGDAWRKTAALSSEHRQPHDSGYEEARRKVDVVSPDLVDAHEGKSRRKPTATSPGLGQFHDVQQMKRHDKISPELTQADGELECDSQTSGLTSDQDDAHVSYTGEDEGGRNALEEGTTVELGKILFAKTGVLAEIMVRKTHSARDFPKVQESRRGPQAGLTPISPPLGVSRTTLPRASPRASPSASPRPSPRSSPSNSSIRSSPPKGGSVRPPSPLLRKAQSYLSPSARGHVVQEDNKQCAQPPSTDQPPPPPSQTQSNAGKKGSMARAGSGRQKHEGERSANKMVSLLPDMNFLYPHSKMKADVNKNSNSAYKPDDTPDVSPKVRMQLQNDSQMFSGGLKLPKVIRFDSTSQNKETISKLSGCGFPLPSMDREVMLTSQNRSHTRITLTNQAAMLPTRVSKLRCARRTNPYPTKRHKPCAISSADQELGALSASFPLPVLLNGQFMLGRSAKEKDD